jgi:hypothetical protein
MKNLREKQKAVTTRFPIRDYLALEEMAEENNTTIAGVVRQAWGAYSSEKDYRQAFIDLEQSLVAKIFEICCSVSGLSELERNEAKSELISRLHRTDKNEH